MQVLVTGASGFVGQNLVRGLVAAGISVRGTHRRSHPPAIAGVQWYAMPTLEFSDSLCHAVAGVDVVVHLAALAHQMGPAGLGRSAEFHLVNVENTRAVARAGAEAGVRRVIFMSSVAAVRAQSDTPVDDSTACAPEDDYGRSKLEAEAALREQLEGTSTDWCILRPPLVYGPGNPGNMERLMKLIETGMPLPFGAIRNRRSFLFIGNLVAATMTVIRHEGCIRSTYALSDGSDYSTPELVRALAAATGRTARLISVPALMLRALGRVGDLMGRWLGVSMGIDSYSVERLLSSFPVDGRRFCETFNWRPPTDSARALQLMSSAR